MRLFPLALLPSTTTLAISRADTVRVRMEQAAKTGDHFLAYRKQFASSRGPRFKASTTFRISCLLVLAAIHVRGGQATPAPPADTAKRPKVLLVQPLVLCDDDGSNPARTVFPKSQVDRVYTRAGVEFLYLEPKRWNYGAARRGEINLDQIVREGKSRGAIPADPRIVSMIFASAVDGKRSPLGRGMQNGNICFVSLGEPPMTDPATQAFVVAHEVGHCLGLIHAVDDPRVPDNFPNLQGDGAFDDRLAINGLHPSQVETILKSPLVTDRVKFLNRDEAAAALTDESWFPFMRSASPDMLRFTLGLAPDADVPADPAERARFARDGHRPPLKIKTARRCSIDRRFLHSTLRRGLGGSRRGTGKAGR